MDRRRSAATCCGDHDPANRAITRYHERPRPVQHPLDPRPPHGDLKRSVHQTASLRNSSRFEP